MSHTQFTTKAKVILFSLLLVLGLVGGLSQIQYETTEEPTEDGFSNFEDDGTLVDSPHKVEGFTITEGNVTIGVVTVYRPSVKMLFWVVRFEEGTGNFEVSVRFELPESIQVVQSFRFHQISENEYISNISISHGDREPKGSLIIQPPESRNRTVLANITADYNSTVSTISIREYPDGSAISMKNPREPLVISKRIPVWAEGELNLTDESTKTNEEYGDTVRSEEDKNEESDVDIESKDSENDILVILEPATHEVRNPTSLLRIFVMLVSVLFSMSVVRFSDEIVFAEDAGLSTIERILTSVSIGIGISGYLAGLVLNSIVWMSMMTFSMYVYFREPTSLIEDIFFPQEADLKDVNEERRESDRDE